MNVTIPNAQQMSRTSKVLFGSLAVATLASFLPWDSVVDSGGDSYQLTPSDLQMLPKILVGVALVAWATWPAIAGNLSKKRCIGLTAAVTFLSLFALTNVVQAYGHSGDTSLDKFGLDDAVKANVELGLVVFAGAMVALWFGLIRAWHGRRSVPATSSPASFPPPQVPAVTSAM